MREIVDREKGRQERASHGDDRGHIHPGNLRKLLHCPELTAEQTTLDRNSGMSLRSNVQNVGPSGVVLINARKFMTEKELRIQPEDRGGTLGLPGVL